MKKLLKIPAIVVLLAIAWMCASSRASAVSGTFTCSSSFYQVISGQLNSLDPVSGAYTPIGVNANFDYNAIGYNVLDNYIYGFATSNGTGSSNNVQSGDLVRIANDGTFTDLGLPSGIPRAVYDNGSFDLSGNLYIRSNANDHTIYQIDVGNDPVDASTMTVTPLNITGLGGVAKGADNVVINNSLYTLLGSNLSVVNLSNETVVTNTVVGPPGWLSVGTDFGAAWVDQSGELFFSNNESGSIYQISNYTSSNPTASLAVNGQITNNNDGTSCPLATQNPFNPPIANNDSYTTTFNTVLDETSGSLLNNDVGDSLTVTSNTQPAHGTVSVNSDGTFIYTPSNGFSGTDSFGYTITDAFGRTASATVAINVSAAVVSIASASTSTPTNTPKTPNTGYGAPIHANPIVVGVTSLAFVSICAGIRLLYRQKHFVCHRFS